MPVIYEKGGIDRFLIRSSVRSFDHLIKTRSKVRCCSSLIMKPWFRCCCYCICFSYCKSIRFYIMLKKFQLKSRNTSGVPLTNWMLIIQFVENLLISPFLRELLCYKATPQLSPLFAAWPLDLPSALLGSLRMLMLKRRNFLERKSLIIFSSLSKGSFSNLIRHFSLQSFDFGTCQSYPNYND